MADPTGRSDARALCPAEMIEDFLDMVTETNRLFVSGIRDRAPVSTSLARSLSSALEANGVLLDKLSDAARRLKEPRTQQHTLRVEDDLASSAGQTSVVLLQGKPGEEAVGAFLLQNLRPDPISATVLPTAFVDPAGDKVDLRLRIEPDRLVLDPGEEAVVTIVAAIPDDLTHDQQLHGAIHVPGLTTSMVPVVVQCRIPDVEEATA